MERASGITVSPARACDLSQVAHLSRLSFAPLRSNAEIEQEWFNGNLDMPGRKVFLATDSSSNEGIGSYSEIDLSLVVKGSEIPALGIAGVAVAPHRRGQGVARTMLKHALENARSKQLAIAVLYPFQHGFYRKFGWAWVGQTYQYRIATQDIPLFPERNQIISCDIFLLVCQALIVG